MNNILEAVKQHPLSMADAARAANLPFGTFKYRAIKLGIYAPNPHHKGRTFIDGRKGSTPLSEILEGKHPTFKTKRIKERLLQEGLIEEKCTKCGVGDDWQDERLVLELDHINGVRDDHRFKNLRLLCPNCHSQTPTFRGRNKNNGLVVERQTRRV